MSINASGVVRESLSAERLGSDDLAGHAELSGLRVWLARSIWLAMGILSFTTFWAGLGSRANLLLAISWLNRSALAQLGLPPGFLQDYVQALDIVTFHSFAVLAVIVFLARPNHRMAIYSSATILMIGSALTRPPDSLVSVHSPMHTWFALAMASGFALTLLFLFIYPDGTVRPIYMRIPAMIVTALPLAFFLSPLLRNEAFRWPPQLMPASLIVPSIAVALAAQFTRFRRTSGLTERLQIRWFLVGSLILASVYLGFIFVTPVVFPLVTVSGFTRVFYILIGVPLLYLGALAFPAAITIAIIRHGLWDVQTILNRTVVYISLTGILAGVYTVSVKVMQEVMITTTGSESDLATIFTTIVVVAIFTPLKNWLQGTVDARFRKPASPTDSLRQFDRQIESMLDVLDPMRITYRLINTAGAALHASSGTLHLMRGGERELVHSYGDLDTEPVVEVALEHEGQEMGWLAFGPPVNQAEYTQKQKEVVRQCAAKVAAALAFHSRLE